MSHEANRFLRTKRGNDAGDNARCSVRPHQPPRRQDAIGVGQALRGITHIPHLLYAEVAKVDGEQLAGIGAAVRLVSDLEIGDMSESTSLWSLLVADTVAVTTPVIDGGEGSRQAYLDR